MKNAAVLLSMFVGNLGGKVAVGAGGVVAVPPALYNACTADGTARHGRAESRPRERAVGGGTHSAVRVPDAVLRGIRIFTEVAVTPSRGRNDKDTASVEVQDGFVPGEEEESLVSPVVEVRDHHRAAERATKVVVAQWFCGMICPIEPIEVKGLRALK